MGMELWALTGPLREVADECARTIRRDRKKCFKRDLTGWQALELARHAHALAQEVYIFVTASIPSPSSTSHRAAIIKLWEALRRRPKLIQDCFKEASSSVRVTVYELYHERAYRLLNLGLEHEIVLYHFYWLAIRAWILGEIEKDPRRFKRLLWLKGLQDFQPPDPHHT